MARIVGISGSLRSKSLNTALLSAATRLCPEGTHIEVASIRGIPLYDGDVEASEGIPSIVQELKARIVDSDALLLVTPEYNNSIPGVMKNAIDWLTRPPGDVKKVFGDRPVALIGASPGGFGTILAQSAWLAVLRTLGTRPYFGSRLQVSHANQVFSETGELIDDKVRTQLTEYLRGLVAFVESDRT
jgi:NAD(P)H-dependent FMN reductase